MSYESNSISLEYIQWSDNNRKYSKTMAISMSPCLFIILHICKMWQFNKFSKAKYQMLD